MRWAAWVTAGAMLALAGCGSITVPASGVTGDGTVYRGTTTASVSGGTFQMTAADGSNTCSGTYDPFTRAKRIYAQFSCTDGRTGSIDVVRDNRGTGGRGTALFSDGMTGEFIFGKDA